MTTMSIGNADGREIPATPTRRLAILASALLTSCVLLFATAPGASAVLIGLNESGTPTEEDWQVIKHSGANVFQMGIVWKNVADQGNWREAPAWQNSYDIQVERAAKNEITLVGGLYGRKTSAALHQYYLSNEWQEWLEFTWTVVQRYGRGGAFWSTHPNLPYRPITMWTVWNEPNLGWNNPGETVLPQKYAEFLVATSNSITGAQNAVRKAGEPNDTRVIHGGLYQPDAGMAVGTFLEKASKVAGYASSFNAFGLHPYSFAGSEAVKLANLATNVSNARTALNTWVGSSKPIWLTELGWPVAGTNEPNVSEAEQAKLLTGSFDWVKANAAQYNLELVTWYFYKDPGGTNWDTFCGLRDYNGKYRESWYAFQKEAGVAVWPPPRYADELGFVRYNMPANTHLDTYVAGPTYKTLIASSDTAYPAISDPQNVQAIAIDTNGDGIDELGFVRLNAAGNAHIDTYTGAPNYKTLGSSSDTGYPTITDPQNVQAIAIDTNGDGIDELGFVRLNAAGNAHIDVYSGAPGYKTLIASSDTGYPTITDPQNVQAIAIDTNGDGIDELGFVRLKGGPGNAHIDTYTGAPNYKTLASSSDTGYPAVSEPQNFRVFAYDISGDRTDELGFLAYKTPFGNAHLDTYAGSPNYKSLAMDTDVAYPAVSDPQNITALPLNVSTAAYDPPGTWASDNLGGTLTSDPDISSWGPGRLDVFAKGTDNGLWHKAFNNTSWFNWEKIGSATLASGPGAVSWGTGRLDMVARKSDNTAMHWWFDASSGIWNGPENLGGSITGDPDIAAWGPNRLDIFAKGTDSGLSHRAWDTSMWFPWDKVGSATLASSPAAVSWGSGRIDMVARKSDNTVMHWWFDAVNGVWNGPENLGGNITSDPDISSWGPNRLDIFAKGTENNLVHKFWNGAGWSGWENLGGSLASGPGAVSWGANRIDVVARASDNSIQHWYYVDP
jgi:hypothetical protein